MDNTFIIDNLLRQNKSESLDYRTTMTTDSIAKAVTVMLNTHGGDILVGVDENKNIVGLKSCEFNTFASSSDIKYQSFGSD